MVRFPPLWQVPRQMQRVKLTRPWQWAYSAVRLVCHMSLATMRNIDNPALQAERLVLLSRKSNLIYQGHTGLRSFTVRCQ